jgi:ketosteroid isomerase-like protein
MRSFAKTIISILFVTWITANLGHAVRADTSSSPENDLLAMETAFAQTMADRSHEAFVGFLSDDVVFSNDGSALRGKQAVADAWLRFYQSAEAPFSWQPEVALVLESGDLGLTSGPVFDPDGNVIGTFNSVWRLEDGRWRIVFDRGCQCPAE